MENLMVRILEDYETGLPTNGIHCFNRIFWLIFFVILCNMCSHTVLETMKLGHMFCPNLLTFCIWGCLSTFTVGFSFLDALS
ncbi:Uncharacterized protein TCM_042241 [Theobroma cacao]|uniref:Uncharacterized protein n=1 Tax=Theobroma cacao TaxID=3641 RepID=A0A061GYS6_THECC|nr:Uncharacterized protein TCM_042241 [Theobroma cacao]